MAIEDTQNRNTRNIPSLLQTFFNKVRNIGVEDQNLIPRDTPRDQVTFSSILRSIFRPGADPTTAGMRAGRTQPPESLPTPTPTPTPAKMDLESAIRAGFENFRQPAPPIATKSAQLAQLGRQLPSNIDPRFPAVLSLKESRGLLDERPARRSNPFNIISGGVVNYPNLDASILGNEEKLGLLGLLREGGLYQDFRDTGDLRSFFNTYTPPDDPANPSVEEQIRRYNALLELFPEVER